MAMLLKFGTGVLRLDPTLLVPLLVLGTAIGITWFVATRAKS